jgi:hypothetical protein
MAPCRAQQPSGSDGAGLIVASVGFIGMRLFGSPTLMSLGAIDFDHCGRIGRHGSFVLLAPSSGTRPRQQIRSAAHELP